MAKRRRLGPSEFERRGPHKSGVFGLSRAWEKLRYAVRTGEDPTEGADLNAKPDDWRRGAGLRSPRDTL